MKTDLIGLGTIINAAAIIIGALLGRLASTRLSQSTEGTARMLLSAAAVWVGLSMTWRALYGNFSHVMKQFFILLVSLMIGHALGRFLKLQGGLNQLGAFAKQLFAANPASSPVTFGDGFVACAIVFCLSPLAIFGAVVDGLAGNYRPLAVKAAMDGLAAVGFASTLGWGTLLSVVPVVAYQGAITLLAATLAPMLSLAQLDSVQAVAGVLVFCVATIMLQLKRIELANYLPSLVIAPLLTKLFE